MNISASKNAVTRDLSRRLFLGGSLATGGLAALTACSSPTPSTKTSSGKTGNTRLVYWVWLDSNSTKDPRAIAQKKILDTFQAKNPDIELVQQVVPWNQLETQYLQAAQTGNTPDVSTMLDTSIRTLADAGALTPLQEFVSGWSSEQKDDYLYPWSEFVIDGKKYAFRQAVRPENYMFYRKDLYQQHGLTPPKTRDEFTQTAITLTSQNIAGWILACSKSDNIGRIIGNFAPMMWAHDSDMIDLKTGKPTFQNEVGVEAFTWFQNLIYRDHVMSPGVSTMDTTATDQQFLSGNVATFFEATAKYGGWVNNFPGNTLGHAAPPSWTSNASKPSSANLAGAWTLVMGKTKNRDAAWRFLDFMQSKEAEMIDVEVGGNTPTKKSTLTDPWFKTPAADYQNDVLDWIKSNPHQATTLEIKSYPAFTDALGNAVQSIVAERADVAKALAKAAEVYSSAIS